MGGFRRKQRGQVIVMVTVSLLAMCGILGLAVDLGWAYFVKRSAQAAADSAARAAATAAFDRLGFTGKFNCGSDLACQDITPCPASPAAPPATNIDHACLYAQRNGFAQDGANGRQRVTVAADTTSPPPTVPGVTVDYWVTVRVSEREPQLFSAVLGNTWATVASRATAAVVDAPVKFSLILLNRINDYAPWGQGVDLEAGGGGAGAQTGGNIVGGAGIILASTANGLNTSHMAGEIQGSTGVSAPMTYIRGEGTVDDPHSRWIETPQNGFRDRDFFKDPLRGKGQPPPPAAGTLGSCPIPNGVIDGASGRVGPGNYYAVDASGRATGDKIVFRGTVNFTTEGSCLNSSAGVSGFGNYVFFGGMDFTLPQLQSANFTPGRYILAGVQPTGGNPGTIFSFSNQVVLTDQTPLVNNETIPPQDAGEIFVFTDTKYPGLDIPAAIPDTVRARLQQGVADLQAGANSSTVINLHGLNPHSTAVPTELEPFRPVMLWQDQQNSRVKYTRDGYIDYSSCSIGEDGIHAPTLENPCAQTLDHPDSPEMRLQATLGSHYWGAVYQPRGAWIRLQGGNQMVSPLQFITGSLFVQGGDDVKLVGLGDPLQTRMVALVE